MGVIAIYLFRKVEDFTPHLAFVGHLLCVLCTYTLLNILRIFFSSLSSLSCKAQTSARPGLLNTVRAKFY